MKKILLIMCLLGIPVASEAQNAEQKVALEELQERTSKIESIQKVFFVRISLLNEELTLREEEMKITEDPHQKAFIGKEIAYIKEKLEREKITLERKIAAVESGGKYPVADAQANDSGKEVRSKQAQQLFDYFKK